MNKSPQFMSLSSLPNIDDRFDAIERWSDHITSVSSDNFDTLFHAFDVICDFLEEKYDDFEDHMTTNLKEATDDNETTEKCGLCGDEVSEPCLPVDYDPLNQHLEQFLENIRKASASKVIPINRSENDPPFDVDQYRSDILYYLETRGFTRLSTVITDGAMDLYCPDDKVDDVTEALGDFLEQMSAPYPPRGFATGILPVSILEKATEQRDKSRSTFQA